MTDEIDRAQVAEACFLREALDRQRAAVARGEQGVAGRLCRVCGEEIAAGRRAALPGCRFCVNCQSLLERGR